MKNWGKCLALVLVCVVLLVAACAPADVPVEKGKEVKIAAALALTGAAGTTGSAMAEGSLGYFKYVNDELGGIEYRDPQSGKTEKVKLDVAVEDSQYVVVRTLSIYKRQQGAGVKALIVDGPSPVEAVAKMAIRDEVAVLCQGGSMIPGLYELEPKYWTMSSPETPAQTVPAMQVIRELAADGQRPKLALIIADVPSARAGFRDTVLNEALPFYSDQIGVDIVAVEWIPFTVTDATVELTRIMSEEPDWIYASSGAVNSSVVIVKDMVRLGLSDKVKLMIYWGACDESLPRLLPEESEGLYGQAWVSLPSEDLPGMRLANEIMQTYYGHDVMVTNLVGLVAGMSMVEGIRLALEEVGHDNFTGTSLNNGLHSIKDFDTGGIWPLITVDPAYPALVKGNKHYMIEGGKFKAIGDWYEAPSFLLERGE